MSSAQTLKPMTSTMWLRYMVEAINSSGQDGPDLARKVGIDLDMLHVPEGALADQLCYDLLNAAALESGNRDFGLAAANTFKPTAIGALGYSMMTAENLDAALSRCTNYIGSLTSATSARLIAAEDGKCFEIHFQHARLPEVRQVHEFCSLFTLNFLRWITGQELHPLRIAFTHRSPNRPAIYRRLFRCPIFFDAECVSMQFSKAQLAIPLLTANDSLASIHDRFAEQRMQQFGVSPYTQKARRLIAKLLPDGEPSRNDIATRLNLTDRTLQRRLEEEGTQFSDILDDVRQNMAHIYLANENISLHESACLLGFSGQSSFTRAINRWFNCTPRELRLQINKRGGDRAPKKTAPKRRL
jgi:AraC-like DNA-binding protein